MILANAIINHVAVSSSSGHNMASFNDFKEEIQLNEWIKKRLRERARATDQDQEERTSLALFSPFFPAAKWVKNKRNRNLFIIFFPFETSSFYLLVATTMMLMMISIIVIHDANGSAFKGNSKSK